MLDLSEVGCTLLSGLRGALTIKLHLSVVLVLCWKSCSKRFSFSKVLWAFFVVGLGRIADYRTGLEEQNREGPLIVGSYGG
ncbi:hypothetical protein HDF08_000931 [Edaphobacter lichenicola]|uniref:Uncharacterized protein n=1 Tax=Tunturiibacter lichenicola TaxID=2051959 RepID=A0A852VEI2_9BACT|nr:hypothetical protein [Edaphobacter lichenicola]